MRVLDTDIDVAANKTLLIAEYKAYFFLLVCSAVLDGISTIYFMSRIGPGYESNLFVRNLSYSFGIVVGPIIGKILQILGVWFITMFVPGIVKGLCVVVFAINCYAFVLNMLV